MVTQVFDVVVIGGGPGGYTAAIRSGQLGFKTACIDNWIGKDGGVALGGTCTNIGCIPSKALLQSSEHFEQAGHHVAEHGVRIGDLAFDVDQTMKRKDGVVKKNNDGIVYLFKKNKVTLIHGTGSFVSSGDDGVQISVTGPDEGSIVAKHVIIATGSDPRSLPGAPFDEEFILSNDGALRMGTVPKRLAMIGSGVVGLELGSVWRRLGAEVTILEALPEFLQALDRQVAKEALKQFTRQGLKIELGANVGQVQRTGEVVKIDYTSSAGEAKSLEVDRLIVSIGRIPNTRGLNPESIGLTLDGRGAIEVDHDCRTNIPNVWAIGDVVRGPMLAHKAEDEGVAVMERIAGQLPEVDFNTIPWVIYTSPEIAWVGQTEEQIKAEGRAYKSGVFPFLANARARALGDTTGFVKILADETSDQVLGVHIIGPQASELIAEGVMVMEFRGCAEDIFRITHAHPTLSEAMKEAALASNGRPLNF